MSSGRADGPTLQKSSVPTGCSDHQQPVCLGIDEAGRGPVLGPMTYGAAYWAKADAADIAELGFDDSKQLSGPARDSMFADIQREERIGWAVLVISAAEISSKMLQQPPLSMNAISHNAAIALIRAALNDGVLVTDVYVDTVGDATTYKRLLDTTFADHAITFTVCPKADATYKVVGAASICAKALRDDIVRKYRYTDGPAPDLPHGSGYPADPVTQTWLARNTHSVFGFPAFVRFSWRPAMRLMEEHCVEVTWPDDLVGSATGEDDPRAFARLGVVDMSWEPVAATKGPTYERCDIRRDLGLAPVGPNHDFFRQLCPGSTDAS